MESLSAIGARVRTLRKRRGLTQAQLAGRIGRSVEALSVLERGRSTPTLPVLGRLSEELAVPLRDFFAPAGLDGQGPEAAAAFTALVDSARLLPPGDLGLSARIVAVIAEERAEAGAPESSSGSSPRSGSVSRSASNPSQEPEAGSPRALLAALLRLYGNDRQAVTATLTRRKRFLLELGDRDGAALLERLLILLGQR